MEIQQAVGWFAVAALFATMAGQAWKQWRDNVKKGIGPLFFVGQMAASSAFLVYSVMGGDLVFIVGNALVLAAAITGAVTLWYNKRYR